MNRKSRKRSIKLSAVFRLLVLLLCLVFITAKGVGELYARYSSSDNSSDEARVAKYYVGTTFKPVNIEVPLSYEPVKYEFSVVNYDNTTQTEVAYNYGFTVSTFENLPLDITIEKKSVDVSGTMATISGLTASDGVILCDSKIEHVYIITIKWKDQIIDYDTSKEIDVLQINCHCEQIS